jgi:DUF4097 and DUF4098 domain-containing protein YvlB
MPGRTEEDHSMSRAFINRGLWRRSMMACLLFVGVSTAIAGESRRETRQTKTQLLDHVADKPLDIRNENGDVEVVSTTSDKVRVKVEIKAENAERAGKTQISAEREGDGTLLVQVKWPNGERRADESVAIKVETPGTSAIKVETKNGRIKLGDTGGEARLRTSNGGVEVRTHKGDLKFETTNGVCDVRDVSGAINAKGINGGMDFETIAGPLTVETTNGALDIKLTAENKGPVNAETTNGGIKLRVGKAFGGSLKADTSNGEVKVELPGMIKSLKQERSAQTIELTNSGDSNSLKASNGDVSVRLAE